MWINFNQYLSRVGKIPYSNHDPVMGSSYYPEGLVSSEVGLDSPGSVLQNPHNQQWEIHQCLIVSEFPSGSSPLYLFAVEEQSVFRSISLQERRNSMYSREIVSYSFGIKDKNFNGCHGDAGTPPATPLRMSSHVHLMFLCQFCH